MGFSLQCRPRPLPLLRGISIIPSAMTGSTRRCRWRNWCGLSIVNSWDDLRGLMSNKTVNAYSRLYETPNDLDLWSAGISETPLTGKQI